MTVREFMKKMKCMVAGLIAASLLIGSAVAADPKPAKTQTCCQKAAAEGKECSNKCCIAAHRQGKSCEKCNPNKEDLALLKKKDAKAQKN
jgi:hypothetical protein